VFVYVRRRKTTGQKYALRRSHGAKSAVRIDKHGGTIGCRFAEDLADRATMIHVPTSDVGADDNDVVGSSDTEAGMLYW
jgi:hypothetical protein